MEKYNILRSNSLRKDTGANDGSKWFHLTKQGCGGVLACGVFAFFFGKISLLSKILVLISLLSCNISLLS